MESSVSTGNVATAGLGKVSIISGITDKRLFQLVVVEEEDQQFFDSAGSRIQPGDMIEFVRGPYSHFALYIKNGMVLHTPGVSSTCTWMSESKGKDVVILHSLEQVRRGSKILVKNHDDEAWEQYEAKPRSIDEIMKAAGEDVGKHADYHVLSNNCEHSCTGWRYGVKFSLQVNVNITDLVNRMRLSGMVKLWIVMLIFLFIA